MEQSQITELVNRQKNYFATGATLPVKTRIEALKKLKALIKQYETRIADALKADLGKGYSESYMCEIGLVLSELTYMIKHTRKFSAEKRVRTPIVHYVSRSFVKPSPYGSVLIMSPWNYPFLLTLDPLIDAIAAGNTVILKPSAYSPATSALIEEMINNAYAPEYIKVITGGRKENSCLLDENFDYIFFTGSVAVGKEVMQKASANLTPVTLELGGKSPCIVDSTANLKIAARRIVFGKYLNCGQTCVAPDYVYCEESVAERFLEEVKKEIRRQFGENPLANEDYGKIINEKHFDRICGLIDSNKVVIGGKADAGTLKIEPTVMTDITRDDAVMKEEIFGPIMPIMTFNKLEDVIKDINNEPHPLALYIFSSDHANIKSVTSRCSYGGGCINDTIIHLATSNMAFGGVGASGMGSYHGKQGFSTFSHYKSIVDKKTFLDLPMRYQPYKKTYDKMVKMFLK